jgi:hypothetical protein
MYTWKRNNADTPHAYTVYIPKTKTKYTTDSYSQKQKHRHFKHATSLQQLSQKQTRPMHATTLGRFTESENKFIAYNFVTKDHWNILPAALILRPAIIICFQRWGKTLEDATNLNMVTRRNQLWHDDRNTDQHETRKARPTRLQTPQL